MQTLFHQDEKPQRQPVDGNIVIIYGFICAIWIVIAIGNVHRHKAFSVAQSLTAALYATSFTLYLVRWRKERNQTREEERNEASHRAGTPDQTQDHSPTP